MEFRILLNNIRSTHNIGSIFRTADAAGVSHIYLTGVTPAPIDRFERARADIAKVALGAEKTMPWIAHQNAGVLLTRLKKEGWRIVGVEQNERSRNYATYKPRRRTVFVFGNEVGGIPERILARCDDI